MSPTAHLLAPSLSPSAILSVSAPSHLRPSSSSSSIIIKQYTLSSDHPLGVVKRIAVGKGKSRDDGGGSEEWMATFDSNNRLSLSKLPPAPGSEEYEDDSVEGRTLKVEACWKVQGGRKVDRCVGSEVLQSGILTTLSSGLVTLHPFPGSSSPPRTAHLPSPLTSLKTIPTTNGPPTHFVAAGKEVDVGVWDMEMVFAASEGSKSLSGEKRKKGELEVGEVWRAKNLPNNHLSLRTPIHHTCLAILPQQPSSSSSTVPLIHIITGTQSGHLRSYHTSQRKPLSSHHLSTGGGILSLTLGRHQHEAFFGDGEALFGSVDMRTGRIMYKFSMGGSSSAQALLSLPEIPIEMRDGQKSGKEVSLVSVGSDATMRFCSTSGVPLETKGNVLKGEVLASVGAIGIGNVAFGGWYDVECGEEQDEEGEDARQKGTVDEDVWDDLDVVADGVDDSDDESQDDEEQEFRAKRRKQEGRT